MDSYWVVLYIIFNYFGTVVPDSPNQQPSFFVIAYYRILDTKGRQSTHYSDGVLYLVALHLRIVHIQSGILLNPNGRNCTSTWFYQIAQWKYAISSVKFASFDQYYYTLHFVWRHSIYKFVLELLNVLVVFENVQNVFML